MKNTIVKIGYGAAAAAMICVPFVAMAQWAPGQQEGQGYGLPTQVGSGGVGGILATVIKWLLYILGFLAVLVFIIAGIMYLTSGGDETRMEKAKKAIIAAIIGIIVALLGLIVLRVVSGLLVQNTQV